MNVRAGSRTLCYSLAMLVAGLGCPSASSKILLDLYYVCMNGTSIIPEWDVHTIYYADDGIDPSSTPFLTCCSVIIVFLGCSLLLLHAWLQCTLSQMVMLRGCRQNCVLSFSLCCWGRVYLTWRLTLLSEGLWAGPTCRLHILYVGTSSSTLLVRGI